MMILLTATIKTTINHHENHSFKPHASFQELALDHEQIADPRHLLRDLGLRTFGSIPARVKKWGVHPKITLMQENYDVIRIGISSIIYKPSEYKP